jgi:hypothetical protein
VGHAAFIILERGRTAPPDRLSSLQFCRIEIFGFGLGENSQNINQVARGWRAATVVGTGTVQRLEAEMAA